MEVKDIRYLVVCKYENGDEFYHEPYIDKEFALKVAKVARENSFDREEDSFVGVAVYKIIVEEEIQRI